MEIIVKVPRNMKCDLKQWPAEYTVMFGSQDTRYISIEARSSIEVVVAKIKMLPPVDAYYFISVPNFGVGIPGIDSLQQSFWIMEKLMQYGMPTPDAVTVAQVLRCLEDF